MGSGLSQYMGILVPQQKLKVKLLNPACVHATGVSCSHQLAKPVAGSGDDLRWNHTVWKHSLSRTRLPLGMDVHGQIGSAWLVGISQCEVAISFPLQW